MKYYEYLIYGNRQVKGSIELDVYLFSIISTEEGIEESIRRLVDIHSFTKAIRVSGGLDIKWKSSRTKPPKPNNLLKILHK